MQPINSLNDLPLALQLEICNKAGFAILAIAGTSGSLRKAAKAHPALKDSLTILPLLKQSYETTHLKKIEGIVDKPEILQEIALLLAAFDIELAISIVNSVQNEPYKSGAQKELVQTILKFNKGAAYALAQTIHQPRYQAEALVSIAEEFAIHSPVEALKIANDITLDEFKAQAYIKIAKMRANFDLNEAKNITHYLKNVIDKITAYCEIVSTIDRNHRFFQELVEGAFSIQEPETKAEALTKIVDILSKEDLQRGLEIKNVALKMDITLPRDLLFLSLIKFLLPLDYEKAIEVFSLIGSPRLKEDARLEIIKNLAMTNITKAREEMSLLTDPENKELALREIGLSLIESDIEEAVRIAQSIEDPKYKYFLLREIVKKYALTNQEAALNIAFSYMETNRFQQTLALSDICKISALDQPKKVLEILETRKANEKILILLECAKEFINKDLHFATEMLNLAITATRSLDDLSEKAVFFTEIARRISTYQWLPISQNQSHKNSA
jgi:hypothetical protein